MAAREVQCLHVRRGHFEVDPSSDFLKITGNHVSKLGAQCYQRGHCRKVKKFMIL